MSDPFNRPGKPDPFRNLERIADALERIAAEIHRHGERTLVAGDARAVGFPRGPSGAEESKACIEEEVKLTGAMTSCRARRDGRPFGCSRSAGHAGDHIASDGLSILDRWPQVRP